MIRVLLPLLLFVALLGGCRKKQPPPPPPPVTLPPPIQPSQTPVIEAPAVQPQTPAVPQQAPPAEIVTSKPGKIAPPPAPPKKQPVQRTRAQRRNQTAQPATTPAPAPATVPAPPPVEKTETPPAKPPQFGELLDEGQRGQYQQQYESSLASARASLTAVAGGKLNPTQADTAERVRGFILEAEKVHTSDIRTAAQLAIRAASLARDLESSLK